MAALHHYSFDFRMPISFSNFMAFCMFPLIFSFPVMNAPAGFSFPALNKTNSNSRITILTPQKIINLMCSSREVYLPYLPPLLYGLKF
jgi:hypothetical protein